MTRDCWHVYAAPEVVENPGDSSLSRLKMLYTQAKDLSESDARYACCTNRYTVIVSIVQKLVLANFWSRALL